MNRFPRRLQLVLIKSKSDQLVSVQPLKPFTDEAISIPSKIIFDRTAHRLICFQDAIREENLLPRDLIAKYQLDQSQIAFTLCTKLPNGSMYIYPKTTVLSSIITEASTAKKTTGKFRMNISAIFEPFFL